MISEQRLKRAKAWIEAFLSASANQLLVEAYLVEFVMRNVNGRDIVELYVDTDTGITIDDCARLTRAMLEALETDTEAQEIFGKNLRLEISSPGISRPLVLVRQYKKNIGRRLRIEFVDASSQTRVVEGTLLAVRTLDNGTTEIELETASKTSSKAKKHDAKKRNGEAATHTRLVLPLASVKEAIVQVEF
ncbi:MAG: ribosome maturation factor RimP [Candidatus Thermochlorobacter sp.]